MADYASVGDVTSVLGTIGNRLPEWVDKATFLAMAHAQVVDRLSGVYPGDSLPEFADEGLEAVRWAEAKIAGAEILEAVRINLPDLGEQPDKMRASAWATIDDGVIGYPIGSTVTDPDGNGIPTTSTPGPRVSSYTPLSAFPDPYELARDPGVRFQ